MRNETIFSIVYVLQNIVIVLFSMPFFQIDTKYEKKLTQNTFLGGSVGADEINTETWGDGSEIVNCIDRSRQISKNKNKNQKCTKSKSFYFIFFFFLVNSFYFILF